MWQKAPPASRCPFILMDVINNGRPLLTSTPGHKKTQASRSGSPSTAGVIIHIHIYTFKFHQVVYLPKHATGWGGKLTKKCGFDRSWRNPAWLSLLRVKPTEWGKCISGRGCLDMGGRGRTEVTREREREVLGKGWIQRLGHNEAHQAGWALRAVTCIGSSPFPTPLSAQQRQSAGHSFRIHLQSLSLTQGNVDPERKREWEREVRQGSGMWKSGGDSLPKSTITMFFVDRYYSNVTTGSFQFLRIWMGMSLICNSKKITQ